MSYLFQTFRCFQWTLCFILYLDLSPVASYTPSSSSLKPTCSFILWRLCNMYCFMFPLWCHFHDWKLGSCARNTCWSRLNWCSGTSIQEGKVALWRFHLEGEKIQLCASSGLPAFFCSCSMSSSWPHSPPIFSTSSVSSFPQRKPP